MSFRCNFYKQKFNCERKKMWTASILLHFIFVGLQNLFSDDEHGIVSFCLQVFFEKLLNTILATWHESLM